MPENGVLRAACRKMELWEKSLRDGRERILAPDDFSRFVRDGPAMVRAWPTVALARALGPPAD